MPASVSDVVAIGPGILDATWWFDLLGSFALVGAIIIVFVETGLLVGFFLPGDSLLFTLGLLVATGVVAEPIGLVVVLIGLAAVLGDQTGFMIGRKAGPRVFSKPDSRLFKQEYVDKTYSFFDRYGPRTILIARFVPIVRTFAPVAAGVGKMRYRVFVTYNVVGALLWGVGLTLIGYFLGQFDFVHDYLEPIILGIVALSVVPIAVELLRARSRRRNAKYDEPAERERVTREDIRQGE